MVWFKVDDQAAFHRKMVAAGNAAVGLWTRAGAWSAGELTDGFVPDHMLPLLGTSTQAEKLISVKLWVRVPGGVQFHEWGENGRQPSSADVREKRAKDAARQASWRAQKGAKTNGGSGAKPEVDESRHVVTNGVSHNVSSAGVTGGVMGAPTRPDPTTTSSSVGREGSRTERAREAQPLPDDWQPLDLHRQMAAAKGVDVDHEAEQFRAHAAGHGRTFTNPHEAFRYWLGNAYARGPARGGLRVVPGADTKLSKDEIREILGVTGPPYPPPEVCEQGHKAKVAWLREYGPTWWDEMNVKAVAQLEREQRRRTAR